jgi:hypothetical protein
LTVAPAMAMDSASQTGSGRGGRDLTALNRSKGTTMSLKLKVLGLGLLATLAMSAVTVMNASATSTGHFTSDSVNETTTIVGSENATHFTEFSIHGLTGIVCTETTYHGTFAGNTSTHLTIIPHYTTCHTTGGPHDVNIDVNGCSFTFTPGHQGTVHVDCPVGKAIVITHPNCEITIPAQTVGTAATGVTYTTDTENNKHTITLHANGVEVAAQFHGGLCVFTGTNHTGTMTGSVTVKGFEDKLNGPQVNITHTAT